MRVYVCEDSFEGLMTAVYSAWADKLGHKNVRLELEGEYNLQLFAEYVSVKPDKEKTEKVIRKLRNISEEVFTCVYRAAMSKEKEKADKIYHFKRFPCMYILLSSLSRSLYLLCLCPLTYNI